MVYSIDMATVGIVGGTGFVGKYLTKLLTAQGNEVIIFTRDPNKYAASGKVTYAAFDAKRGNCDIEALKKLDSVVHLAGAGIADKRWSDARKKEILDSRVESTNLLTSTLKAHASHCKTFVAASATGFYGPDSRPNQPFTEQAAPYNDFLGETCNTWENASKKGAEFMRTTLLRFGIVLGKESGAFPEFVKPMAFGIMPILGSGKQMVSWIEVEDLARLILFAIDNEQVSGIYNAVSPNPVSHRELMNTIAKAKGGLKIPAPVPAFVLQIMLGELSIEVLKSCNVSAQKITDAGFEFSYPDIKSATLHILAK